MDPRERTNDMRVAIAAATKARQAMTWTALPAKITKVDMTRMVVEAQPQILITTNSWLTNKRNNVKMPPIPDCPILFPGGGGFHLTFPVLPGDECLLLFASRCIDGWWSTGGLAPQGDLRMHDLSDGFALVGVRSLPNVLNPVPSGNTVQLRSDDGACYVELAAGHICNVVAPGGVNIIGNVTVTGSVLASGEGTFNGGHTVSAHVHPGVTTGGSNTQPPTG